VRAREGRSKLSQLFADTAGPDHQAFVPPSRCASWRWRASSATFFSATWSPILKTITPGRSGGARFDREGVRRMTRARSLAIYKWAGVGFHVEFAPISPAAGFPPLFAGLFFSPT
jgi:hypothetical protein